MEQSPYQVWLSHSTGEIFEPEPDDECEHDSELRWNAGRGQFECTDCGEVVECPELQEALTPELRKPYDLVVGL